MHRFKEHIHYPFPTREEKGELRDVCGITETALDEWFWNQRKRAKDKPWAELRQREAEARKRRHE